MPTSKQTLSANFLPTHIFRVESNHFPAIMPSDTASAGTTSNSQRAFEFIKRKRWADLLVTELADGVNLVLSRTYTILFCAPAMTELTGWKVADLIDRDFSKLLASLEDQTTFQASFNQSVQNFTELHSYLRIKCNGNSTFYQQFPKGRLFEVKGQTRAYQTEGPDILFFITAKPYPGHSTEQLNTYLDLQMENDQLQRRRMELTQQLLPKATAASPSISMPNQTYDTPPISACAAEAQSNTNPSKTSYTPTAGATGLDTDLGYSYDTESNNDVTHPSTIQGSPAEDDSKTASKKKKTKTPAGEQYVCRTCGRTDSPEWRKGPEGPKTLCNACGLRWAKQTRSGKADEP